MATSASKVKPLGYEPSKAILKNLSFGTRQQIHRQIPSLRSTNSLLPYQLETVRFSNKSITIDSRTWRFKNDEIVEHSTIDETGLVDFRPRITPARFPNRTQLSYNYENNWYTCQIEKPLEKAYEQLFDTFFKNGAVIRGGVSISGLPSFFHTKNMDGLQKIQLMSTLRLGVIKSQEFHDFVRFADFGKLECIVFESNYMNVDLVGTPEFANCPTLKLTMGTLYDNDYIKDILNLKNRYFEYEDCRFKTDHFQRMVEEWISSQREVGTRFSLKVYHFDKILDMFDLCRGRFGAVWSKHPELGQSFHANGVTVNMGMDRELVMFSGKRAYYGGDTFEMEVMKIGSSVKRAHAPTFLLY